MGIAQSVQTEVPGYTYNQGVDNSRSTKLSETRGTAFNSCVDACNISKQCVGFQYKIDPNVINPTLANVMCLTYQDLNNKIPDPGSNLYVKDYPFALRDQILQTKPVLITCDIATSEESSNSTDDRLTRLVACQDQMKCNTQLIQYNNNVTEYNKKMTDALQQHHDQWTNKKSLFLKEYQDWTQMRGKYQKWMDRKIQLNSEENFSAKCSACTCGLCIPGNMGACPNGWMENRQDTCYYNCVDFGQFGTPCGTGCRKICKRTPGEVMNQLNIEGYQQEKPIFVEPEPTQDDYPLLQNITNINMQCCSNYANVSGNTSDDINSCLQTLEQLQNNPYSIPYSESTILGESEAEAESLSNPPQTNPTQKPVPGSGQITSSTTSFVTTVTNSFQNNSTIWYIIIGVLVLLLILSCVLSLRNKNSSGKTM